jgi:stearoyl-CoA desaturase (delta-9 desaturase)
MEPDAKMVLLSDVAATKKRHRFTHRSWNGTDIAYIAFMVAMHGLCLLAPATFSWPMVALFAASYLVTGCLGITLSFHRQLSHKAFTTPKWLEYALAYCGVLAIQVIPPQKLVWAVFLHTMPHIIRNASS